MDEEAQDEQELLTLHFSLLRLTDPREVRRSACHAAHMAASQRPGVRSPRRARSDHRTDKACQSNLL